MESKRIASTILSISCRILVFVLVAMVLLLVGREAYGFGKKIFMEEAVSSKDDATEVIVEIPSDYSKYEVAKDFANRGLVADSNVFYVQIVLSDDNDFTPGVYTLNTGMLPSEILAAISIEPETEKETSKSEKTTESTSSGGK